MVMAAGVLLGAHVSAAVQMGDTRDAVLGELGSPLGIVRLDEAEILYFERGSVELRDGKVVRADVMSPQELKERREREAHAREVNARIEAEQRVRRVAEGEAVLKQWLASPDFLAESPRVQVERWCEFMIRYPEVSITEHYGAALERLEGEMEQELQERRIAELEQRVAEAEARALSAEEQARRRRVESTYYIWPDGYSTWVVPTHWTSWPPWRGYPYTAPSRPRSPSAPAGAGRTGGRSAFSDWPYDFGGSKPPPPAPRPEPAAPGSNPPRPSPGGTIRLGR